MIDVIMLSGGLDSVGLLINRLQDTDNLIHAHHIILKTCEDRWQAENDSVEKVVEYCRKNYRSFSFSTSTYEFPDFSIGYTGMDILTSCFIGANVVRAVQNRFKLLDGVLYEAGLLIGFTKDDIKPGTIWNDTVRKIQADKILEAQFLDYENLPCPTIKYPNIEYSQRELYDLIPAELKKVVWSCRRPVYLNNKPIPCGMCHACQKEVYSG